MKKLTTLFLTLALFAGLGFALQAADAPKKDSYEAMKSDPKSGVGHTLVEITKKDKDNLFTADRVQYLRTQAKYLAFAEDNLFQWFEMPDGRYALMYKTEVEVEVVTEAKRKSGLSRKKSALRKRTKAFTASVVQW